MSQSAQVATWRRRKWWAKDKAREEFLRRYARAKGLSLREVYRRIKETRKGAQ